MNNSRFILTPYKGMRTRYECPACNKPGEFARYIDTESKYSFPDHIGRCNRESSCGYHYTPSEFFRDNPDEKKRIFDDSIPAPMNVNYRPAQPAPKPIDYFDERVMLATMAKYEQNSFTNALQSIFDTGQIGSIIDRYKLGTTKSGAVVFWQIDINGRIRYGKAMHYLSDLHRDKSRHPVGVHSLMKKYDFNYKQCFFGEYLLKEYPHRSVCIVESEKSACICSEVLPGYIWLATGGKNGCKWTDKDVCSVLKGRKVILFPDVDAHNDWTEKAAILRNYGIQVSISDYLAKVAPGTQQDIADHLIIDLMNKKQGVKEFTAEPVSVQQGVNGVEAGNMVEPSAISEVEKSAANNDYTVLERMKLKNPALSLLIDRFDLEVISTDKYEPEPDRNLSRGEIVALAAGLPDNDSFTIGEISRMLGITTDQVKELIEAAEIYFIPQNQKYCKQGGIPF